MKTGPKPTLLTEELEAEVEKWYHQWLHDRNKKGEVVTINILDMLKDFARENKTETVTKLILELQQNMADNGGILDYQRFESVLISAFKKQSTPSKNKQWQSIFDFISFYLGGFKDNGKGQSILNTQVAEITIENLSKELADKFSQSSTPSNHIFKVLKHKTMPDTFGIFISKDEGQVRDADSEIYHSSTPELLQQTATIEAIKKLNEGRTTFTQIDDYELVEVMLQLHTPSIVSKTAEEILKDNLGYSIFKELSEEKIFPHPSGEFPLIDLIYQAMEEYAEQFKTKN